MSTMAAYINVDYFASNVSKSISPSLSSDDSNTYDSALIGDHFILKEENPMSPDEFSMPSSQESTSSALDDMSASGDFSKVDIRRLKNRESAARSRLKIKNKLNSLEKSMAILEGKKGALINEKGLLLSEIETLENQMIGMSLEKMKGGQNGNI